MPCTLSAEVFERLDAGLADAAVLPIENSLHGAVADHSDLLLEHGVVIVAELSLRIRHVLIAPDGVPLHDLRRVLSHPVALSQCRRFFAGHPEIEAVPFYDTAGSVKHILRDSRTDTAAIAAPKAAEVYGGKILARDLEDDPQNFTRFFLLAPGNGIARVHTAWQAAQGLSGTPGGGSGNSSDLRASVNKMSFALRIAHRPGSLVETLQRLAAEGADLTRIESRPVPGKPWEYVFFIDLRIPVPEVADRIRNALLSCCSEARELGRYSASVLS